MRFQTLRHSLVAVLALAALAACADPSAPVARGTEVQVLAGDGAKEPKTDSAKTYVASGTMLQRLAWLKDDMVASVCVDPAKGKTLVIKEAGLTVTFPAGAVSAPTCISATAFHGGDLLYEFAPHGTQFLVPITIQQDLKLTNAYKNPSLVSDLFGGYVPNGEQDIAADGTVSVSETFPIELLPDKESAARWASFKTTHFSGYVLASGRTAY